MSNDHDNEDRVVWVNFTLNDLKKFQNFEKVIVELSHLNLGISICPDVDVFAALRNIELENIL